MFCYDTLLSCLYLVSTFFFNYKKCFLFYKKYLTIECNLFCLFCYCLTLHCSSNAYFIITYLALCESLLIFYPESSANLRTLQPVCSVKRSVLISLSLLYKIKKPKVSLSSYGLREWNHGCVNPSGVSHYHSGLMRDPCGRLYDSHNPSQAKSINSPLL